MLRDTSEKMADSTGVRHIGLERMGECRVLQPSTLVASLMGLSVVIRCTVAAARRRKPRSSDNKIVNTLHKIIASGRILQARLVWKRTAVHWLDSALEFTFIIAAPAVPNIMFCEKSRAATDCY
jgi:hypothetical protein